MLCYAQDYKVCALCPLSHIKKRTHHFRSCFVPILVREVGEASSELILTEDQCLVTGH
jgi:hypothetical protein